MVRKWHKNCGGKVMYQKPMEKGVGFKEAGKCLKCNFFPILEEDIIFEVDEKKVEIMNEREKKWNIAFKHHLKEVLESD